MTYFDVCKRLISYEKFCSKQFLTHLIRNTKSRLEQIVNVNNTCLIPGFLFVKLPNITVVDHLSCKLYAFSQSFYRKLNIAYNQKG